MEPKNCLTPVVRLYDVISTSFLKFVSGPPCSEMLIFVLICFSNDVNLRVRAYGTVVLVPFRVWFLVHFSTLTMKRVKKKMFMDMDTHYCVEGMGLKAWPGMRA